MFLAIAIPTLASIFWFLWQRCDEDQDDEMKNASYREQVFAWVLGVGLLLCCISMVVFVSLLLVGSSLIQSGATDSSDAMIATLPQVCLCCAYLYVYVVCVCLCVYICVCFCACMCLCSMCPCSCVCTSVYVHMCKLIHCTLQYKIHTHTYIHANPLHSYICRL